MRMRTIWIACFIAGAVTAAGCIGPPSKSPHRHDHMLLHGHRLVYDPVLGVYVVTGLDGVYYYNGYYYRHRHGYWYVTGHPHHGWQQRSREPVPPGLTGGETGGPPRGRPDAGGHPVPEPGERSIRHGSQLRDEGRLRSRGGPDDHMPPPRGEPDDAPPGNGKTVGGDRRKDEDKQRGHRRKGP